MSPPGAQIAHQLKAHGFISELAFMNDQACIDLTVADQCGDLVERDDFIFKIFTGFSGCESCSGQKCAVISVPGMAIVRPRKIGQQ